MTATPGKVIYLGHLVLTYRKLEGPGRSDLGARDTIGGDYKIPADRRRDHAGLLFFLDSTSWNYQVSVDRKWDRAGLRRFLTERGADSPWLDREVVEQAR